MLAGILTHPANITDALSLFVEVEINFKAKTLTSRAELIIGLRLSDQLPYDGHTQSDDCKVLHNYDPSRLLPFTLLTANKW
jgi:hypothetical protein